MRVLLVDDDEGFRATLRDLLTRQRRGVQVEEATDGEGAVRLVATHPPDVVLMDLTMPRMNGVEATRQVKTLLPDLPVIILTVHDDPVYERAARAVGADAFVLKKTAGTTLWPTLAPLVARKDGAGPGGGALAVAPTSLSEAYFGLDRSWNRESPPWGFRDRPDRHALPSPL